MNKTINKKTENVFCGHYTRGKVTDFVISENIKHYANGEILSELQRMNVNVHLLSPCVFLPQPIASHADMCMYCGESGEWTVHENAAPILYEIDKNFDIRLSEQAKKFCQENSFYLENTAYITSNANQTIHKYSYPYDASLDCLKVKKNLLCGAGTDKQLIENEMAADVQIKVMRQGYVKCSICVVNENAFITEDVGIAKTLIDIGADVLLLNSREIELPGYNCGFVGGASFKIASNVIAFFGKIENHSEFFKIKSFCANYGCDVYSMSRFNLTDFGGGICIKETI